MSASERFLFRGFKILNVSLKVPIKTDSFRRASTMCRIVVEVQFK